MSRENIDMDGIPDSKETSLRNHYAAMANVFRYLAEAEADPALQAQRRRESRKLKELALRENPPKCKQTRLRTPRHVYTVMAGCGVGEFLWRKSSDHACLVGGNMFSLMEIASDHDLISSDLFNALSDWAREYMAGEPEEWKRGKTSPSL